MSNVLGCIILVSDLACCVASHVQRLIGNHAILYYVLGRNQVEHAEKHLLDSTNMLLVLNHQSFDSLHLLASFSI